MPDDAIENPQSSIAYDPRLRRRALLFALGCEGGLVVVAWLLGWLLGQPPLKQFEWSWVDAGWGVVAMLPMFVLFLVLVWWPVGPLARIKQFIDEIIGPLFGSCTLLDLAVIAIVAGVGEEMLFRGVLQGAFSRWLGFWPGLILASILFGLAHLITPTYALLATLIGIYLGWVWTVNGNLLVVIMAHGLYDFLALVYLLRGPGSGGRRPGEVRSEEDLLPP